MQGRSVNPHRFSQTMLLLAWIRPLSSLKDSRQVERSEIWSDEESESHGFSLQRAEDYTKCTQELGNSAWARDRCHERARQENPTPGPLREKMNAGNAQFRSDARAKYLSEGPVHDVVDAAIGIPAEAARRSTE